MATSTKNLHLEHLEDDLVNLGSKGAKQSIAFIESLLDLFKGDVASSVNLTVKWDGAPAIVTGTDPETGLFFIATKHAAFAKDMRLAYSEEMIDLYYEGKGSLITTLKTAFRELKDLGISEVLQGDIMFTPEIKKHQTLDGENCITFKPNTIVYAIPNTDPLYEKIQKANLGVVFHTVYRGSGPVNSLSASFGADVSRYTSPTAWIQDASYHDVSGTISLTDAQQKTIKTLVSRIKTNSQAITKFLDMLAATEGDFSVAYLLKIYINKLIRENTPVTLKSMAGFKKFIIGRIVAKQKTLKTAAGQEKYEGVKAEIDLFFKTYNTQLRTLFVLYEDFINVKNIFVEKLNNSQTFKTFLETEQGFRHTSPEGYVAINKKGQAVKLVNRLEFSSANFNAVKDWKSPAPAATTIPDHVQLRTLVFAFGRMNPPTIGHKKLVDKIVSLAKQENCDHLIVISHSQNKKTDPLDPDTKLQFAQKMFPAANITTSSTLKPNFFKFLEDFNNKYDRIIFVAGSDRIPEYKQKLAAYQGKLYTFKVIDVVSAGERDPDAEGATGISASKMRQFAKDNDYTKFRQGVPRTLSESDTKSLMQYVRNGLGLED
jgi:hypothetical protein